MPVCEVTHTQNTVFPDVRPARRTEQGNLAVEPRSFIGREVELAALQRLQTTTRHLTLVGPGGVGKSRLAARLSRTVQHRFHHGTWFVDLAAWCAPRELSEAILDVLGQRARPDQNVLQALIEHLRDRQVLLVLDNCERVISGTADITSRLLRACPSVHVLATSREPLGIEGEVVWRVPPLSLPLVDASQLAQLEASEAVQLFVARVRDRVPDFSLTRANSADVVHICHRLGGLPLALELVVARVHRVGLHQLATRLDSGSVLGLRGGRGAPSRHRTLRATVDWSYQLLSEPEQVLLRRLAVFSGGWTLPAAEAVCSDDDSPIQHVADHLSQLVSRSLVQAEQGAYGTVRYCFLDPIRDYAVEQLGTTLDAAALRARHAAHMLTLAERMLLDASDAAHPGLLVEELDNLRVALRWAAEQRQTESAVRLAVAAGQLLQLQGKYAEGEAVLQTVLKIQSPRGDDPVGAAVCHLQALIAGHARLNQGRIDEALVAFREATTLAVASGSRMRVVPALEGVAAALGESRPETAVRLAYAAGRLRAELGAARRPHDAAVVDAALSSARGRLSASVYASARDAGCGLTQAQAAALALSVAPAGQVRRAAAGQPNANLTRREREVVQFLVRGLSTRQIADLLSVSPDTVRTHVDHVMAKFDLHSRVQLVAWATRPDA